MQVVLRSFRVEIHRDNPVLIELVGAGELVGREDVVGIDCVLDALEAVGLGREDRLDKPVTWSVVETVRGVIAATLAAGPLPQIEEVGERGTVVLEPAAPSGERRLAVEYLLVGDVGATCGIAVEEDRHVGESLVDPRDLGRVRVLHQQVL